MDDGAFHSDRIRFSDRIAASRKLLINKYCIERQGFSVWHPSFILIRIS